MAEEMAGTETIPSEVALATPDAMAVDDVKADGVIEPEILQPEVVDEKPVPAPQTEEEKLWSAVTSNAGDFQSWTKLISETEQNVGEDFNKLRTVYDKFLEEFPLCYGYWKKYADHEKRHGDYGKPVEVYERAVGAVTYSVDIWMHYAVYKSQDASSTEEEIRSLFERGLQYVGSDWNCYILWDKYVEYELSRSEWGRAAELYTRLLQIPSATLDKSWERFKECAGAHPLNEIASALEYEELSKPEPTPVVAGEDDEAPPAADPLLVEKTDAEKVEKYIASRGVLYKSSKERVEKVKEYESQIKRPYFHIKALDDVQLNTWHKYLDFIEKEGDLANTVRLYERCVIPGANYPEFWVRYVSSMEESGDVERAQDALTRATTIFVKRRPEIFLFAAKRREQQGDLEGAEYNFSVAHHLGPGLLESTIKHANFERRQGNPGAGVTLYEQALQTEKAKEASPSLPHLYLQYARYLDQAAGDSGKAREVYKEALEKTPTSKSVWQATMVFEASKAGPDRAQRILAVAQQAVAAAPADGTPSLTAGEREELSAMAVELVELYGDAVVSRAADIFHRTHFSPKRDAADTKKRAAPDSSADRGAKHHKSGAHGYRGGEYSNGGGGYQGSRGPPAGGYGGGYAQQPPQGPAAHAGGYGGYNAGYYPPSAPPAAAGYGGYAAAPYAAPQAYAAQPGYGAAPAAASYYPPQQSYYPQ